LRVESGACPIRDELFFEIGLDTPVQGTVYTKNIEVVMCIK